MDIIHKSRKQWKCKKFLDHEYTIDNMSKLKNTYTIYTRASEKKDDEFNNSSQTKTLEEYEYNGKKYVRVEIDSYDDEKALFFQMVKNTKMETMFGLKLNL